MAGGSARVARNWFRGTGGAVAAGSTIAPRGPRVYGMETAFSRMRIHPHANAPLTRQEGPFGRFRYVGGGRGVNRAPGTLQRFAL